ncbi:hypothetical protein Scep_028489 [Stephania cephalantha]|uniref:Uncharacterized protein n=1 Tax=Stephania cephalantha TaxID=152367 RepID=A0AAP0ED93_9MAGN
MTPLHHSRLLSWRRWLPPLGRLLDRGRGAEESARRWWSSFLAAAREGDWYSTTAVVLSKRAMAEAVAERAFAARRGEPYSSGVDYGVVEGGFSGGGGVIEGALTLRGVGVVAGRCSTEGGSSAVEGEKSDANRIWAVDFSLVSI